MVILQRRDDHELLYKKEGRMVCAWALFLVLMLRFERAGWMFSYFLTSKEN
ncbi:unnamed protein product [Ectocarpus sp. CCAP 1310/34]|nr:unnamed protein product [Ectocarpus sp. CCAP 1310/34]